MPPSHTSSSISVPVLLPLPLAGAYDYLVPDDLTVAPGDLVRVPLGQRSLVGVVWDAAADGTLEPARLKPIAERLDLPPLRAELRRLVDWVAGYTMAPPGAVLRMALGPREALEPEPLRRAYRVSRAHMNADSDAGPRLTDARRRVMTLLSGAPPLPATVIAEQAGCGAGVVRSMVAAGLLEEVAIASVSARPVPDHTIPGAPLSEAQAAAAQAIEAAIAGNRYESFLVDGVTGSGKTEVYFRAIAHCLAAGRQALVLLPEIALGAQWHERFEARFGAPAAAWHSEVSSADRRRLWRDVATGTARVVVGARSALFLPFQTLGLIVIDEEHDGSFKQEEGVVYHARDMAVVRGSIALCPVVLASATPSLETHVNAERGRYRRLILPDRHGGARLPEITLMDLRRDRPARGRFLAPGLVQRITETIAGGEQVMLFLNRRGYAPLTLCRACGHRLHCPNCSAWLVEHRLQSRLICHHCAHAEGLPPVCPSCGTASAFAACGPGVERIAEEVAGLFPDARLAVMASDTLVGPRAAAALVAEMLQHRIDILVGTQIMAKGHHFPLLTLVGVVDADLGLAGGDPRAAERTYQMLHQVAGRAGRADRPGQVLLQTFDPDHPVMRALASGERDRFLAAELKDREARSLPPFGRLAALIVSADDAEASDLAAAAIARAQPHVRGATVLGPAPAPLAVLRGRHRRRFLIKADRQTNLQVMLRGWLERVRLPGSVRVQIDIDPVSFL